MGTIVTRITSLYYDVTDVCIIFATKHRLLYIILRLINLTKLTMMGEPHIGEVASSAPSTVTGNLQLGNPCVSVSSAENLQLGNLLLSIGMLHQRAVPQQSTIPSTAFAL